MRLLIVLLILVGVCGCQAHVVEPPAPAPASEVIAKVQEPSDLEMAARVRRFLAALNRLSWKNEVFNGHVYLCVYDDKLDVFVMVEHSVACPKCRPKFD